MQDKRTHLEIKQIVLGQEVIINISLEKDNIIQKEDKYCSRFGKNEDIRFNKLAKEIIKEVYIDLYNITNKRYSGYMENSLYSNDYYSTKTQNRLEMFNKLAPNYNMNEKYPELWYLMNRLEIKQ